MTNLEKLQEAKNGEEFVNMYEYFNGGCMQGTHEIWKNRCLSEEYRGNCRKCRIDFWNSEFKESELPIYLQKNVILNDRKEGESDD